MPNNNNSDPIILSAAVEPVPCLIILKPKQDVLSSCLPPPNDLTSPSFLMEQSYPTTYVYNPEKADINHIPTRET